jgi:diguanylate cyclase (GGDEF)-like protein/PAS domain S-box-containing protein
MSGQPKGIGRRLDHLRASSDGPADAQRDHLWTVVYRCRAITLALLAVGAAVVPGFEGDRLILVGLLALVIIPGNHLMYRSTIKHGHPPASMPYVDQIFAPLIPLLAHSAWNPVLFIMVTNLALVTIAYGRRVALKTAVLGALVLVPVSLVVDPPRSEASVLIYLVLSISLAVIVGTIADAERKLRRRYGQIVEGVDAIVWEGTVKDFHFTYVSPAVERILGYPAESFLDLDTWANRFHRDDRDVLEHTIELVGAGVDHDLEYRLIAADGRVVHMHDHIRIERDEHGEPAMLRGVAVDVTAQREAEVDLHRFADVVENIETAIYVFELDEPEDAHSLRIVAANPRAEEMMAFEHGWDGPVVGTRLGEILPNEALLEGLAEVVRSGTPFDIPNYASTRAGAEGERTFGLRAFPLPGNAVGLGIDDITEAATAAETLRHQALHDALTGLPNRALLTDRLRQAVSTARRTNEGVALLVMDLDQFKEVNDALGHHHGDLLLVEIARRLEGTIRECDTIARLGGDEFAVLLTVDADEAGAVAVATKVARALEQPFFIEELSLQTNASIGIALFPEHAGDAEELVRRADVAMYNAKRGTPVFTVYAAEHDRSSVRRLTLLGELRRAIDLDELVVYFQPTIDLRSGRAVRAEALVRWQHPEHGLMGPGEFIELAEVSGMIQPLTRWVCERAMHEAREWVDAGFDLGVSVNLSVRNLYDPDLVPWLQTAMEATGLPEHLLTLEITESEVMEDPLVAHEVLGKLRAMGVSTSIDDFGTGHSSLAYLKHLPIDEIKVDRSFVGGMGSDASDATIVRSIIDLGRNLGLGVVAEGVEDEETLHRLADLGCDRAQGFVIGRPMPASSLRAHLRRQPGPRAAWVPPIPGDEAHRPVEPRTSSSPPAARTQRP